MGIGMGSRCRGIVYQDRIVNLNPNPKNFKILKLLEIENTYVEVLYPDARNYEGRKILVYAGQVAQDIMNAKELDPHFSADNKLTPIARFKPDAIGEWMAVQIAKGRIGSDN